MLGGIMTSTFGGVVMGDWRGVVAGVLLLEEAFDVFSFCSELRLSGSEMLPPNRNLVGGTITSLRSRFSGRKNFERPQQ